MNSHNVSMSDFDPVSYETWRALVEKDLKGVSFEKKLVSSTFEGIPLKPLYTASDLEGITTLQSFPGFPPYIRGGRASGYTEKGWEISQEMDFSSAAEFNEAARNSVERGLTALNVVLDKATRNGHDPDWAEPGEVGVGGLSIATIEDLDRALAGIDLSKTSLFIRSGSSAMPIAALLMALVRRRGQNPENLRGCIEMDPLGVISHEGGLPQSLEGSYREMSVLTRWAQEKSPKLQTICVHTRAWHESGGHAVQELAFGLATGVEYLRAMMDHHLPINDVAPRLRFAMTVGNQFFMEISKLRALRMLWSQVVSTLGGDESAQRLHIHARTSHRNKTVYDPTVNLLRGTVEAFAAVLSGVDSLQVGAFDETFRTPDDFSRRLARNTQLILEKESNLTPFIDPAGGSFYLEKLSHQLAHASWELFQKVEAIGGMTQALRKGFVQDEIEKVQKERCQAVATRKSVIVGTTKYANPQEKKSSQMKGDSAAFQLKRRQQIISYRTQSEDIANQAVLQQLEHIVESQDQAVFEACVAAIEKGATLGEVTRSIRISDTPLKSIRSVKLERSAQPFERLRDAVESIGEKRSQPLTVFLATMGPASQHRARADFSRDFFEVAGFKVIYPKGFETPEKALAAAAEAKSSIVVICSTDETYPHLVPPLVEGLKNRVPGVRVVLAGYPAEQVEGFKKLGVDEFIHLKANALDVLSRLVELEERKS
ncbi:MAG: Methylmalonyl-CoA mutase [Elusimicrobia bacterium]|nr:Methylmalonyl-CoA mutase [Elusimicrobiota bacterium]